MNCPLCGARLAVLPGLNRGKDGEVLSIFLACPSKQCPAQEVCAHARNEAAAYEIILDKYKPDAQTEEARKKLL